MGGNGGEAGRLFSSSRTAGWMHRSRPWSEESMAIRGEVDREISRSRRYGGKVSVAWIEFARPPTTESAVEWRMICERVGSALRQWDTCWHYDEGLLLLLPQTDSQGVNRVAERVLRSAGPHRTEANVSAATFPDDAPTTEGLFARLATAADEGVA